MVDRNPQSPDLLRAFVNGRLIDTRAASSVRRIHLEGLGGNDTLEIDEGHGPIAIDSVLSGGAGKNLLVGGSGPTMLDGGPGRDSLLQPGTGPGPFIETDSHGYAIAASASDEAGLSVTSAQVQEATAESLDSSSATVKNPGNLADLRDEAYYSGKLSAGSTDTDKHSTSGRVFALETVGGGVLAFYALTAQLTLAPPAGQTFQVSIPGFYSDSQTLTSATIGYAEQFAAYIPPGQASPQILADASGMTGRE